MFEWKNLPESMDERFLEKCLFFEGKAALLKSKDYGFINTHASDNGFINIYGIPSKFNCYTEGNVYRDYKDVFNGLVDMDAEDFSEDNYCVLVKNDNFMTPTAFTITKILNM